MNEESEGQESAMFTFKSNGFASCVWAKPKRQAFPWRHKGIKL